MARGRFASHGGDGLGPVYNDSSCVACHNLGGSGGGGAASKNVDIITASPNGGVMVQSPAWHCCGRAELFGQGAGVARRSRHAGPLQAGQDRHGAPDPNGEHTCQAPARTKIDTGPLVKTHPGFRTSRSVVLHRFGTEGDYESWRQSILGFAGGLPPRMDRNAKDQFQAQNCRQFRAKPGSERGRPVHRCAFAAQPDGPFRCRAPGLDPGTGDRRRRPR